MSSISYTVPETPVLDIAGKSVPEHMLTYDISSMFEMGTGKVLSQEVAGTAAMARPLSIEIPGLWLMYEEVSS
jgi:hypothetical protein